MEHWYTRYMLELIQILLIKYSQLSRLSVARGLGLRSTRVFYLPNNCAFLLIDIFGKKFKSTKSNWQNKRCISNLRKNIIKIPDAAKIQLLSNKVTLQSELSQAYVLSICATILCAHLKYATFPSHISLPCTKEAHSPCLIFSSQLLNCMQNDVTAQHLGLASGQEKPRLIFL